MVLKATAWLAVVFGALAALAAVALNGSVAAPFLVLFAACAVLLVLAGVTVLRRGASPWLTGAWGFACATAYGVFFSQAGEGLRRGFETAQEAQRAYVLGGVGLVAALCFVLSLLRGGVRDGV